jgi:hypothetical protein
MGPFSSLAHSLSPSLFLSQRLISTETALHKAASDAQLESVKLLISFLAGMTNQK